MNALPLNCSCAEFNAAPKAEQDEFCRRLVAHWAGNDRQQLQWEYQKDYREEQDFGGHQ